jgi:hypothetical protein
MTEAFENKGKMGLGRYIVYISLGMIEVMGGGVGMTDMY